MLLLLLNMKHTRIANVSGGSRPSSLVLICIEIDFLDNVTFVSTLEIELQETTCIHRLKFLSRLKLLKISNIKGQPTKSKVFIVVKIMSSFCFECNK